MKHFNTMGVCVPEKHYMADTSVVVESMISDLIEQGKYFTINRARQYGKTTTLNMLERQLKEQYIVLSISFEAADDYFVSLYNFVKGFVLDVADILHEEGLEPKLLQMWEAAVDTKLPLRQLGKKITELCRKAGKKIVLIIDEVDKNSDNQIFLSFLGLLRDKYLKQLKGKEVTFQSVILAGVYDIKNMKLRLRSEEEHKYNSPWNIAADFTMDMALQPEQIRGMLDEYVKEHDSKMDTVWFSERIYAYTSGYPFLVSAICKEMEEHGVWTEEDFQKAVKKIVNERSTLFDDINKNIDLYPLLGKMFQGMLLQGKEYAYTLSDNTVQLGAMFGYFVNRDGLTAISNRIFEMYLYDLYYKAIEPDNELVWESNLEKQNFIRNDRIDINHIIERFAVHYRNMYQEQEREFLEEQCRFLFLTFLRPIINGSGNYYIEARTRDRKRMDVVIDYLGRQYIVELKIWHGERYQQKGREQLVQYLDGMNAKEGWLLTFSFLKNKRNDVKVQTKKAGDKKIYELVV